MKGQVVVRIEDDYEDGHHASREVTLPAPEWAVTQVGPEVWDLDSWWETEVWPHTGDGHGIGNDMGAVHTATVVKAHEREQHLIGLTHEWS